MQLVPAGVVKAVSSPNGVVVPPRKATRKSASSTGGPASTQAIASATGCPAAGAAADDDCVVGEADGRAVPGVLVVAVPVCDPVIGVSAVGPGLPAGTAEHPASSADAAINTAIRIPSG